MLPKRTEFGVKWRAAAEYYRNGLEKASILNWETAIEGFNKITHLKVFNLFKPL